MMGNLTPFVVNGPPVTNTNTVNFTGGPWTFIRTHVDSSAETLATWRLDEDTSSKITFENDSSSNAIFRPSIYGYNSAAQIALALGGVATADTGANPVIRLIVKTAASGAIVTRPTWGISNQSTIQLLLSAGGVLNIGNVPSAFYSRLGQKLETNTSATYGGAALNTWSATAAESSILDLNRSKSATIGTHTVVANNDGIGGFYFRGSDGTAFINTAMIRCEVDGTPGTNDMPGRLLFGTTPDGSAGVIERMRITNAGDVGIGKTPTTGIILDVGGQLGLKSYTVATLPSASVQAGAIVYASDAGGNGPCIVVSNGTNWKRCDNTSTTVS